MIPIQNIYYMLSYAFRTLTKQGYREMSTEKFSNTADLMTEILIAGILQQLKRGLGRANGRYSSYSRKSEYNRVG